MTFEPCEGTYSQTVRITVNGVVVASGRYGGEPEDNTRTRDYRWVERAVSAVARALGADVEVVG